MPRGARRRLIALVGASVAAAGSPMAGRAVTSADNAPQFGRQTVLPSSGGAEPSIAIDYSAASAGKTVYVASIQPGANLWHSFDSGQSWSQPLPFDVNGPARGSDADVSVAPHG